MPIKKIKETEMSTVIKKVNEVIDLVNLLDLEMEDVKDFLFIKS